MKFPGEAELSVVGSLGQFLSQILSGGLFLLHRYRFEKQRPGAFWHSHLHQKLTGYDVLQFTMCASHLKFSLWPYFSRVPELLALVLVSFSLKLPSQLHAKSPKSFWKPSNFPLDKSNQLSKEKKNIEWVIRTLGFKNQFSKESGKWP